MNDTNEKLIRARSIPSYVLTFKCFHLLGARVKIKPDSSLPVTFHGAIGTIINYDIRLVQCYGLDGVSVSTKDVAETWTMKFDTEGCKCPPDSCLQAAQVLLHSRDQFEVIGESPLEETNHDTP